MKILATRGDVYSFAGTPIISYVAACPDCAAWPRSFTTAEARDKWVADHEEGRSSHRVAVSTEVQTPYPLGGFIDE